MSKIPRRPEDDFITITCARFGNIGAAIRLGDQQIKDSGRLQLEQDLVKIAKHATSQLDVILFRRIGIWLRSQWHGILWR